MERKKLVEALTSLHDELARMTQVDAETVSMLESARTDIQTLLDCDKADSTADSTADSKDDVKESEPLPRSLHDLFLRFEVEHPHIASMIAQVSDGLAALGI